MKTRIKSKSFGASLSFPRVFPIFICLLFALFIIEKCFCLSLLLLSFSFQLPRAISSLFHFFRPRPSCIHVSFHPANIHTNSILKLDTQKVIPLRLLLLAIATRYLNFILMFVPSINFYNPFINLIKQNNPESSFVRFRRVFPRLEFLVARIN